jgi:hypothetical protein
MTKEKEDSKGEVVSNGVMTSINAQQVSEREEKILCNDDIRNRTAVTFIQSCWR